MKLVKQNNHETCQQACIAMLAGVCIDRVIDLVGDKALGVGGRSQAFAHFQIDIPDTAFVVGILDNPLVKLMRDHRMLFCNVADWKDPNWGHAILIYDGHVYDPWRGIDPEWPWTRHVWRATQVTSAPGFR